jgi:hypothetical protein
MAAVPSGPNWTSNPSYQLKKLMPLGNPLRILFQLMETNEGMREWMNENGNYRVKTCERTSQQAETLTLRV